MKISYSSRRWNSQKFWRRSGSENIHFKPGEPRPRGEEQGNLQGESEGSSSTPRQDSPWYAGEAKSDFWSTSGEFIYRHHVEPRVKLYVPTEESFPVPLKYIDVTRTRSTVAVFSKRTVFPVGGWYIARRQYSSLGEGAAGVSLGAVHMEGVQVRVQAELRKRRSK